MNKPWKIFKQRARFFGLKIRRYAAAVILATILVVTLLGNSEINALDHLGFSRLMSRNVSPKAVLTADREFEHGGGGISSTKRNDTKDRTTVGKSLANDVSENASNSNIYPSDGYKRAEFLRKTCANTDKRKSHQTVRVSFDEKHNALFCPLCKIASTFWTRVFKMLDNNNKGQFTRHPFEVPISQAPPSKLYFDVSNQKIGNRINAQESFKFMFVRSPYSMLFSAFVDKIVGPNPSLWKTFKTPDNALVKSSATNACGAYTTFEQFLRNIVQRYKLKHTHIDCHVANFDACQPCAVNYTFVAKMETFKDDTFHIMSKMNQTQTLKVFENEFSSLHADDAIDDSTSGPFSWKGGITKCITWSEALQRIWRKLQIRGIIGADGFPLTDDEATNIAKDRFIALLKETRMKTTSAERRWQKEQAFKEAYRSVPIDVLDDIKNIYSDEFLLFDYNNSPDEIFGKNVEIKNYKLLDYTNIKENITRRN